eukprot:7844139-Lingulodinium_polyedra.AAC.1
MPWIAETQWVEPWPTHESVVNDTVYFTGESDADADTNTSDDSGRGALDLSAVSSLPDAQQLGHILWAYRTAKK